MKNNPPAAYPALQNFIPLPRDPKTPLTAEQIEAMFPNRSALRSLLKLGVEAAAEIDQKGEEGNDR